ncbi:polysaccharide deacetylase family protein [Lysinibacillus fusiformis]|uniref:polysaccharide deacetylase family protein n=1 Tax=Lysinibacillus fusiformis TaxID=28031 RepID=UPI002E1C1EFA|nr:polysaccharide deacetylase family protein [Lysinibacillus fusiformis]MED4886737.1 polysaccharide deacetylase family protein [Lysinibacillus fusiformis]
MNGGGLVISLDFELNWGVHDVFRYGQYNKNLYGVRKALPSILALFEQYDIHATWATVGLLFAESKAEMAHYLRGIPVKYENMRYAAHSQLAKVGENEQEDLLHFGKSLIEEIKRTPHQEIGSHTFSHYYCLEKGQTEAAFYADLDATKTISEGYISPMKSIVFPRNQVNIDYFKACVEAGYVCYRGTENHPLYDAQKFTKKGRLLGAKKWLDSYINLTGHHMATLEEMRGEQLINIRSSAFLRPYFRPLHVFEGSKVKRIKESMLEAAKAQAFYHLWWHPHNFGKNTAKNLAMLEELLLYFQELRSQYNFQSYSMYEVAELCENHSKQQK